MKSKKAAAKKSAKSSPTSAPKASSSARRKGPKLVFFIDAWETLDHEKDTTLRLVEEAMLLGAECFLSESRTISLEKGAAVASLARVKKITRPRTASNISREAAAWLPLAPFDHFFYRTDPPVDLAYLLPFQILASVGPGPGKKNRVHASPDSIFLLNEKWGPAQLGSLFPKSVVSASVEKLLAFIATEPKVVLKPLYQAQSKGVAVLERGKPFLREKLLKATEGEKLPVILQQFLPGIMNGETRLWFVDGKLLSAVKKIPKKGEAIIDMDGGGSLAKVKLSASDQKAVLKIGALLKREGILWAAVDLIDGQVTDFNHTSPGLLVAMENLLGENLAKGALSPLFR